MATTTTTTSNETLISDSQLRGFSAFRERLGYCCCRVWKKTSKYDLSAATTKDQKQEEEQQQQTSTNNKSNVKDKDKDQRERQKKLDRIAQTLPQPTFKQPRTTTISTNTVQQKLTPKIPTTTTTINAKKEETTTTTTGKRWNRFSSLIRSLFLFVLDEDSDEESSSSSSNSDSE